MTDIIISTFLCISTYTLTTESKCHKDYLITDDKIMLKMGTNNLPLVYITLSKHTRITFSQQKC